MVLTLVGLLVAGAVYWFVIRDDDNDTKDKGSTNPPAAVTYTAPGNSFSFQYPGSFANTTTLPQGYVFIGSLAANDLLGVKRIANEPTSPGRLAATIPSTLKLVPGTKITSKGRQQVNGVDMVTFAIDTVLNGKAASAKLYYFSANGVTWQLSCVSQTQKTAIDVACTAALDSFRTP